MVRSLFTSETYLRDSCAAFFLASISPLDSRSNCNRYLVIKVQYLLTKATLIANGLNTGVLVVQMSSYWYSVIILVGEIWKDLSVPLETMTGVKSEWKEFVRWWFCKSGRLKLNGPFTHDITRCKTCVWSYIDQYNSGNFRSTEFFCVVLENIPTYQGVYWKFQDRMVPKGPNYARKVHVRIKIKISKEVGNSNQNTLHGRDTDDPRTTHC